jgi:hypothetical protein
LPVVAPFGIFGFMDANTSGRFFIFIVLFIVARTGTLLGIIVELGVLITPSVTFISVSINTGTQGIILMGFRQPM